MKTGDSKCQLECFDHEGVILTSCLGSISRYLLIHNTIMRMEICIFQKRSCVYYLFLFITAAGLPM